MGGRRTDFNAPNSYLLSPNHHSNLFDVWPWSVSLIACSWHQIPASFLLSTSMQLWLLVKKMWTCIQCGQKLKNCCSFSQNHQINHQLVLQGGDRRISSPLNQSNVRTKIEQGLDHGSVKLKKNGSDRPLKFSRTNILKDKSPLNRNWLDS